MLEAGQSLTVPIVFTPRDHVEYIEQIEFVVNDFQREYVTVRGRGTSVQLELTKVEMHNVEFGAQTANTAVTKTVTMVNRSARTVEFSLQDPEDKLAERSVSWTPAGMIQLR